MLAALFLMAPDLARQAHTQPNPLAPSTPGPLAADPFVAGIRRDWKYRYLEAWWLGWKIRLAEARAPARGESIFLIVSCRK